MTKVQTVIQLEQLFLKKGGGVQRGANSQEVTVIFGGKQYKLNQCHMFFFSDKFHFIKKVNATDVILSPRVYKMSGNGTQGMGILFQRMHGSKKADP